MMDRETAAHTLSQVLSSDVPEIDWNQLRGVLDEAMHDLSEADRKAVLLRFFEKRSLAEVGARLGLSENTARMRVERALDKLLLWSLGLGFWSFRPLSPLAVPMRTLSRSAPFPKIPEEVLFPAFESGQDTDPVPNYPENVSGLVAQKEAPLDPERAEDRRRRGGQLESGFAAPRPAGSRLGHRSHPEG